MDVVSDAEAGSWLGRRAALIVTAGCPPLAGRVQHVSSRSAFLLEEDRTLEPFGGTIGLVPLERIVSAVSEDATS